MPRATALAMRGRWDDAAAVLERLESVPRPFRRLDYEKALARAWVAAGQGAVSEAIAILRSAAETAESTDDSRRSGVPADGDTVRGQVVRAEAEGTRSGGRRTACRSGGAVRRGDGEGNAAELATVSDGFDEMGDRVAAVEAAAQASLAYRRQDLTRVSAGVCGEGGSAGGTMRSGYADAAPGEGTAAADGSGARNCVADRPGLDEQRRSGATDAVDTHRRGPHLPGDEQDPAPPVAKNSLRCWFGRGRQRPNSFAVCGISALTDHGVVHLQRPAGAGADRHDDRAWPVV